MSNEETIVPSLITGENPVAISDIADQGLNSKKSEMRELLVFLAQVAFLVVLVRSLFIATFNIPSESMLPRLMIGDYLIVNKFAYGYSRHSLPFSPKIFEGRLFSKLPEHGDVVVFKAPPSAKADYIKRVIGLPGDQVQMRDGVLYVNRKPLARRKLPDIRISVTKNMIEAGYGSPCSGAQFEERGADGALNCVYPRFQETWPSGKTYQILDTERAGTADNTDEITVPQGHIFFMGDNRDRSADSRYPAMEGNGIGIVPMENLVGKAWFTVFSVTGNGVRWSRIGEGF
jgi:signal peptidase I